MLHKAFCPQVPIHGSTHLFRTHAFDKAQSVFKMHSGRQPAYGSPKYSSKQVQAPSIHFALAPHGDVAHGSTYSGSAVMIHF